MDESDANPQRRVRTSGTRPLCTHAAIASLTRPPRAFGPATTSSITPSLHLYMAYAAQTRSGKPNARMTGRCDFSSLAYHIAGINCKLATPELKLGSFEPRAEGRPETLHVIDRPLLLFLGTTHRHQQITGRRTSPRVGGRMAPVQRRRSWDQSSIATGLHGNEAFLPLAAEQEGRRHVRSMREGVTEGPGGLSHVSLQREKGVESEGAVRGAEEGVRAKNTYGVRRMWKGTLGGFDAAANAAEAFFDRRRSNRGDGRLGGGEEAVGRRGRGGRGREEKERRWMRKGNKEAEVRVRGRRSKQLYIVATDDVGA
ncbi:predicted protein [Histoplasma mississippiense (nom. inval.)]|uniref:predicted protein n=1 Tax=Ajellomyces capsulatus (strain NAm1 / WU24) TaxID=2059318 RepID=UPI000157CB83|nr:predicted protein [Histoplasma mississippiense (nom. inval.)]EDN10249.1 predicted protein [Histoplasma mississippiense (nom. inval.)]